MFGKKQMTKSPRNRRSRKQKTRRLWKNSVLISTVTLRTTSKKRMSHPLKKSHPVLQVQKCILLEVF